jgi:hypothetical protein
MQPASSAAASPTKKRSLFDVDDEDEKVLGKRSAPSVPAPVPAAAAAPAPQAVLLAPTNAAVLMQLLNPTHGGDAIEAASFGVVIERNVEQLVRLVHCKIESIVTKEMTSNHCALTVGNNTKACRAKILYATAGKLGFYHCDNQHDVKGYRVEYFFGVEMAKMDGGSVVDKARTTFADEAARSLFRVSAMDFASSKINVQQGLLLSAFARRYTVTLRYNPKKAYPWWTVAVVAEDDESAVAPTDGSSSAAGGSSSSSADGTA